MSTDNSVDKTSKQWAWEFLRRNKGYLDAFETVSRLTEAQVDFVHDLGFGRVSSISDHLAVVSTLPTQLFDANFIESLKERHVTIGDYLADEQVAKYLELMYGCTAVDALVLRFATACRTTHYGLTEWVDPSCDMTPEVADRVWQCPVYLEFSLHRKPSLDEGFAKHYPIKAASSQIDSFIGPMEPSESRSRTQQQKSRKLKPKRITAILDAVRGVNGAVFFPQPFYIRGDHYKNALLVEANAPAASLLTGYGLARATFDLSLPVECQIAEIRKRLLEQQKELQMAGFVPELPSRVKRLGAFGSYIAILDMLDEGKSTIEIATTIKGLVPDFYIDAQGTRNATYKDPKRADRDTQQEHTVDIRKQIERARAMRDHGYRSLALQGA